jgi:1-acyl-sn-glycerol-3-phosphate acyltransferase
MSRVETLLRIGLAVLFMVLISTVFFTLMFFLLPWRHIRLKVCNVYGKINGRALLWFSGARPVIHNRERIGSQVPAIFVSNHVSTLDMWVGMWICPIGGAGLAKREIMKVPGLGQLYMLSGHPMIDRSNRERAIATMQDMADFMNKHKLSLWLWPEGTRSRDGRLQPFKKGFVHAAIATGLPIVPIVVHNAGYIWPRTEVRFRTADLHVEVLQAVDTSDWSAETLDVHVAEVWAIFAAHLGAEE